MPILNKLGEIGMCEVYLAEDTRLNPKVALKLENGVFLKLRVSCEIDPVPRDAGRDACP